MFNNFFLRKSCSIENHVEKCGGDEEAKDDNIIMYYIMRFACSISKATRTHALVRARAHSHTNI